MNTQISTAKPIMLSITEGVFCIHPSEITRMEARSNYTFIYFTNRKPILIAKVLREFEDKLSDCGFIRTHRTHLINSQYINYITADKKIVMTDNFIAAISRRMKPAVMKKLHPAA